MRDTYTLRRVYGFDGAGDQWFVVFEGAKYDVPQIFSSYFPVRIDRSNGIRLFEDGLQLESSSYGGVSIWKPILDFKRPWLAREIMLTTDGKAPPVKIEYRPFPPPKSKCELRYEKGRWQKYTRGKWVDA